MSSIFAKLRGLAEDVASSFSGFVDKLVDTAARSIVGKDGPPFRGGRSRVPDGQQTHPGWPIQDTEGSSQRSAVRLLPIPNGDSDSVVRKVLERDPEVARIYGQVSRQLEAAVSTVTTLQEHNTELVGKLNETEAAVVQVRKEMKKLGSTEIAAEIEKLKKERAAERKALEKALSDVATLESRNAELGSKVANLSQTMDATTKAQQDERSVATIAWEEERAKLKKEIGEAWTRAEEGIRGVKVHEQAERAAKQGEVDHLKTVLDDVSAELDASRAENATLKGSGSLSGGASTTTSPGGGAPAPTARLESLDTSRAAADTYEPPASTTAIPIVSEDDAQSSTQAAVTTGTSGPPPAPSDDTSTGIDTTSPEPPRGGSRAQTGTP